MAQQPAIKTMTVNKNTGAPTPEGVLEDFRECHKAYNYKDALLARVHADITRTFFTLVAILAAVSKLSILKGSILFVFVIGLGLVGFQSLLSMSIEVESLASCKVALRKAMQKLEETLHRDAHSMSVWKSINGRRRHSLEAMFKKQDTHEGESGPIVFAARCLLALWILVAVSFAYSIG